MIDRNVHEPVVAAWTQALGLPLDALEMTWDQAGGDSLKALQLFMTLERQLGRKLDLALLRVDMTADKLAEAIQQYRYSAGQGSKHEIILFPAAGGDEPRLAEFRQRLAGDFCFCTIRYPGVDKPLDVNPSKETVVANMVDQVRALSSQKTFDFAAYSLGGSVAAAVACEMERQGFGIRSLIAIDCMMEGEASHLRQYWSAPVGIARKVALSIAYGLFNLALVLRLPLPVWHFLLRQRQTRGRHDRIALFAFHPPLYGRPKDHLASIPVTLLRAISQQNPAASSDLGWRRYADRLSVIPIRGDHRSCLTAPHLADTCDAFRSAFIALQAGDQNGADGGQASAITQSSNADAYKSGAKPGL